VFLVFILLHLILSYIPISSFFFSLSLFLQLSHYFLPSISLSVHWPHSCAFSICNGYRSRTL
jgi:hypothetical protein